MDIPVKILDQTRQITGIEFHGRLDAATQKEVKTQIHLALVQAASLIILDLQYVPFIDSSGLSALVSGLRAAREQNKDIILVGLTKQAQMVFNLTMMDRVFTIFPSVSNALTMLTA